MAEKNRLINAMIRMSGKLLALSQLAAMKEPRAILVSSDFLEMLAKELADEVGQELDYDPKLKPKVES